jgi:hypothetical protein
MAINATNESNGSNYQPLEAGTYAARCYSMVHIGTVTENVMGTDKQMNKVRISWEIPTELKEFKQGEGEKPYVVSKEFTLSLHEKATLRKFLESWRGKNFTDEEAKKFDITKLLGIACMISVTHKTNQAGKTYAEITSVSPVMKGFEVPAQINKSMELNYDNFNFEFFETLPDFIKIKMKESVEYKKMINNYEAFEAEKASLNVSDISENLPF